MPRTSNREPEGNPVSPILAEAGVTGGDGGEPGGISSIHPGIVWRFLCGDRSAIVRIAGSRQAIWLGLACVLLAGFFREYDQESLLHEPWYLVIPLFASLGLSLLLMLAIKSLPECRSHSLPPGVEYRRMLACLWLTAPLAVIYAVPVERFLTPYQAMQFNLSFLGIVSAWRVLLFSRVAAVLYGTSLKRVLFPILFLADTVMILAIVVYPLPLIEIMGGLQLTASENLINAVRFMLIQVGVLAWPILFIGTCLQACGKKANTVPISEILSVPVARSTWVMCGAGLLVMLTACLVTQPEQQRRYRVEYLLSSRDYAGARELLIRIPRTDFPPQWEPGAGQLADQYLLPELKVMLESEELPDWVANAYGQRLARMKGRGFRVRFFWMNLREEDLPVLADFLVRFPAWSEQLLQENEYVEADGTKNRNTLLEMIAAIQGGTEPTSAGEMGDTAPDPAADHPEPDHPARDTANPPASDT